MGEEGEEQQQQQQQQEESLERAPGLGPGPMTPAQFLSWKRQKDAEASARKAEAAQKRVEDIATGTVQMNGRELFAHEPWVFDNTHY